MTYYLHIYTEMLTKITEKVQGGGSRKRVYCIPDASKRQLRRCLCAASPGFHDTPLRYVTDNVRGGYILAFDNHNHHLSSAYTGQG